MPKVVILTEQELRQVVQLDNASVDCIESAFAALSTGNVVSPPIMSMAIEDFNGEVDVKTAYVPGIESFAIKMSPGYFDNPQIGLPSTSGLMILFSARTGMVEAVLLDNGYLTNIRTAAAGAVAARHLARSDAERVCIVGTGQQSRLQLEALCLVHPIRKAKVWGRNLKKAKSMATELAQSLNISVDAEPDLKRAVGFADIVVTTTPSTAPLVKHEWLRPGQHITAMGSDQEYKIELDPRCLSIADIYVADLISQTEQLGELHHALEVGAVGETSRIVELSDIIAGKYSGRQAATDITICDLTGTGVQDTAIATYAHGCAERISAGLVIQS